MNKNKRTRPIERGRWMAHYYGDIPCVKINNIVHIARDKEDCLCGEKWSYSVPVEKEAFSTRNIIWRELNAVTCKTCLTTWRKNTKQK